MQEQAANAGLPLSRGFSIALSERQAFALIVAAILIFGAVLRFPGLWQFPLEQDEIYTIIESRDLLDSPLNPGIEARPLYYLMQHAMFWFTSDSPLALRIMPFTFGMLGIWAVWLLGRQTLGPIAGAAAALFTAIAPFHMHISGMARYGSLIFLLSALFFYFLAKAYQHERSRDYLAALVCLLLGTLTHPTFIFPVAGIAAGALLIRHSGRLGWRAPSRLELTRLWLPYAALLVLGFWILSSIGLEGTVRNWDGRGLLGTLRLLPAIVQWISPVMFAAGILGAGYAYLFASEAHSRRWGALILLAIASTLSAVVLASLMTNVYADYANAMFPLLFVGAGALVQLAAPRQSPHRPWRAFAVGAALTAAVLPGTVSHYSDGTRFDFRPAFETIATTAPELTVLTTPIILQRHYAPGLQGRELRYEAGFLASQLDELGDMWVAAPARRYGLVHDYGDSGARWLSEHCRLEASHQRQRLDYRLYRVDLYRCRAR